jgi:hypothetical protein
LSEALEQQTATSEAEQSHILDRDHRLIGEGRDQLNLLVGEGPDFTHDQDDNPQKLASPEHRNSQK